LDIFFKRILRHRREEIGIRSQEQKSRAGPRPNEKCFFFKKGIFFVILSSRRKNVGNENQLPLPAGENAAPAQESNLPNEQAPPPEQPILLSKLFPDAKHDLDNLFPDPQMKQLLKEVHRTRQGNQRFLKRLNLSKVQNEGDDSDTDS
jgi:hypothetical protein